MGFTFNKPADYDTTPAYTGEGFDELPAGAYVCVIKKVEPAVTKTGKNQLLIYLEIDEGEHKGYYTNKYKSDTRANKKWGAIVYQLTDDGNGGMNKFFKGLITSVEESNNTKAEWGNGFGEWITGKRVGCLFHREEYVKTTGGTGWITKPFRFLSTDSARSYTKNIADVPLNTPAPTYNNPAAAPTYNPYGGANGNGFETISDDDDLPF